MYISFGTKLLVSVLGIYGLDMVLSAERLYVKGLTAECMSVSLSLEIVFIL